MFQMRGAGGSTPHRGTPRPRRRVLAGVVAAVVVAALGVGGYLWVRAQQAISTITQASRAAAGSTAAPAATGGSPLDLLTPQALNGESTGRANILMAGNAFDDPGHGGADLTDSIMVASMDVTNGQVALISVPRDLLVDYRGTQMKINAVYAVAATGSQGSANLGDYTAGMDALGQVVEQVTGLHIDEHILVGYNALEDAVNAVGGIDVTIKASDPRGISDPSAGLLIGNGPQHIDGPTALALARARNDPVPGKQAYGLSGSDFDREADQRMILAALLDKVKTTPTLANPVTLSSLFDTLSRYVRTDLTVGQFRRVYDLGSAASGVQSVSVKGGASDLLANYSDATNVDALVPTAGRFDYSRLKQYVASVLK